ncbi:MAG: hypothetical protein SGJ10_01965 [Bacteroidota bacterium]|nr:hypothetical protein [Bacteroidota bacterium]
MATVILIPIYHYHCFEIEKQIEDKNIEANKNRKEGDLRIQIEINGNNSGMDGFI